MFFGLFKKKEEKIEYVDSYRLVYLDAPIDVYAVQECDSFDNWRYLGNSITLMSTSYFDKSFNVWFNDKYEGLDYVDKKNENYRKTVENIKSMNNPTVVKRDI